MVSRYLNSDQVYTLVSENLYSFPEYKFQGRCFSGEFKNSFHLPALSIPGGDWGELAILLAAADTYGFEIDINKAAQELFQLSGGNKHLLTQDAKNELSTCDHLRHMFENMASYNLKQSSLDLLYGEIRQLIPDFHIPKKRRHVYEHALLIFEASQGLYPQYSFETYDGSFEARVLVFHKTLVDLRHRELSSKLLGKKIVTLYDDLDADYLYQVISEITEIHLYETMHFIDPDIPLFLVKVNADQDITVSLL